MIPFATVSTVFVTGIFDKAYAATEESAKSGWGWNPLKPITDSWENFTNWLKAIPHNIAEFSVNLMADLYQLSTDLILKTPLWIFDNEWFHNTTYKFSLFAIGIVSVLSVVESVKRMLSGVRKGKRKAMDMKDILKRWFLVSGALTAIPFLFQKAFQGLNFVSETINSMGADTVKAVAIPENIKIFDILTVLTFDLILIASMVPILWKNGRRFFDIMVLGVISPFALTAWIFDSYRHLFNQWWDNLKHLSLVQIYYAVFLLMLGWFLFGTPTPDTFSGMLIKMLVVIGGFARMVEPPRIVSKHLDNGGGFDEVWGKNIKKTKDGIKKNIQLAKDVVKGPTGLAKRAWKAANPAPKVVKGTTRMQRLHKK